MSEKTKADRALNWSEAKKLATEKQADAKKVFQTSIWLWRSVEDGNDSTTAKQFNKGEWEMFKGSPRMLDGSQANRFEPGELYLGA